MNALHLSAVGRSDKVGCHSAKAARSRLSSEKQRSFSERLKLKAAWRQEAFSMLNYFHYVFSDAYWLHSRRVRGCSREAALSHVPYISRTAETMAQDRHILTKVILERFLWPSSLSPLLTNEQNETIKTGTASATTEVVKSLAEVRCAPYYSGLLLLKQQSGVKLLWNF